MLQIISGKFYKSENRYASESKGILYSNFSWGDPIRTCVATLEPVEVYGSVSSYVLNYINQIEQESDFKGFAIVKTGDYEIVKQFKLLASFGLKAYFDIEKSNVQMLCRKEKIHNRDDILPSAFTRRFLDNGIMGKQLEVDKFVKFIKQSIGLPRATYKTVISCLSAFETSLRVLDQDINLAYSIMIYTLETLSQSFDEFSPSWEDYDQNQREELEKCFYGMDEHKTAEIKSILTKNSHLKLTKRFVEFITKYINNDFYCNEAVNIESAIKKNDVRRLLINAYNIRSGYVHNLRPLLKQITIQQIAKGDVFIWENEPYLTYAGLCRLTHHVIYNFILQQPYLEKEDYYWQDDLPGIVTLNAAPQYWIWKHEGISQEHSTNKLEGFLSQLASEKHELTDIRELLKKYEHIIPNATEKYKLHMLATYYLYNTLVAEEYRVKGYNDFIKKYEKNFDVCCIENMVVYLFINEEWPWKPEECEEAINTYLKRKYKKNNLKIPSTIELAVFITLANLCEKAGFTEKQKYWLEVALYDCPGQQDLQNEIKNLIESSQRFDINKLVQFLH